MARRPRLGVSVVFRVTAPHYRELKRWARERNIDMADILRGLLEQERARIAASTPTIAAEVTEQAA